MGHEVQHFATIDGHLLFARALADPTGYGESLQWLRQANPASNARLRAYLERDEREGRADPTARAFLEDCEAFVAQHPHLSRLTCDLDRQYEALAFVLRGMAEQPLFRRACFGGDVLPGLTGCQGWPVRWLSPDEVRAIAAVLAPVERSPFTEAFGRCAPIMEAEGVYKAHVPTSPEDAAAWEQRLWGFFNELRDFFAEASGQGLAVFTWTD